MTGQVDEAGREARWIETLSTKLKRSSPDWPQRLNFLRACMEMADEENAVLAGQVAAIRALCEGWDWLAMHQHDWNDDRRDRADAMGQAADAIRAALVASSPTTPKAPK